MRIVAIEHLTLDGVMQAPGGPDDDTRDGFARGGWATAHQDDVIGEVMGARMGSGGGAGLLFGRRTYEQVLAYWNTQPDSPFTPVLNESPKYVASTTLTEPLPWPNSTLLPGNVRSAVAELRSQPGGDLTVLGSGELVRSLMPLSLVDELLLLIHPLVVGAGRRLFGDDGWFRELRLVDAQPTPSGVLIVTYEPT